MQRLPMRHNPSDAVVSAATARYVAGEQERYRTEGDSVMDGEAERPTRRFMCRARDADTAKRIAQALNKLG